MVIPHCCPSLFHWVPVMWLSGTGKRDFSFSFGITSYFLTEGTALPASVFFCSSVYPPMVFFRTRLSIRSRISSL